MSDEINNTRGSDLIPDSNADLQKELESRNNEITLLGDQLKQVEEELVKYHNLYTSLKEKPAFSTGSGLLNVGRMFNYIIFKINSLFGSYERVFFKINKQKLIKSRFFDEKWYLEKYPDVYNSGMSAYEHFVKYGMDENRSPGPYFNTTWYLQKYPDIEKSKLNPLLHYIETGFLEGRQPNPYLKSLVDKNEQQDQLVNSQKETIQQQLKIIQQQKQLQAEINTVLSEAHVKSDELRQKIQIKETDLNDLREQYKNIFGEKNEYRELLKNIIALLKKSI